MKICAFGIPTLNVGKHNLKDPRLDIVDDLVEAEKKTYAQVEVVGEEQTLQADVIVVGRDRFPDLILHDLEFVEKRLERDPQETERELLLRIRCELEAERTLYQTGLSAEELQVIASQGFKTHKPVVVAGESDFDNPAQLLLKAFREAGYICFLTVGGKENRAWPIRSGITAWEAAGAIHSDIQKGFIRAEVISYNDLVDAGGETEAKRAGKLRLEHKSYVVQDYDIVSFRFNKPK